MAVFPFEDAALHTEPVHIGATIVHAGDPRMSKVDRILSIDTAPRHVAAVTAAPRHGPSACYPALAAACRGSAACIIASAAKSGAEGLLTANIANLCSVFIFRTHIERCAGAADLVTVPPLCPLSTTSYDFSQSADLIHARHHARKRQERSARRRAIHTSRRSPLFPRE